MPDFWIFRDMAADGSYSFWSYGVALHFSLPLFQAFIIIHEDHKQSPNHSKFYCPKIFRWAYGLCRIVTTSDGEVTPPLVTGFIPVNCEFISWIYVTDCNCISKYTHINSEKTQQLQKKLLSYTNSIHTAEPWFLQKPQATDLSHALGLVSWLPAAPAPSIREWLGEFHSFPIWDPKKDDHSTSIHDDLVFSRKHCWIFLECLGRVRLIDHFLVLDMVSNVYGFCYMFLAALLIGAWLIHATLEAEIPAAAPWIFVVGRGSHLKFVRWLDFLCFNRMV